MVIQNNMGTKEKKCTKCFKSSPEVVFGKSKDSLDGWEYSCKTCKSIYAKEIYIKNRDKIIERAKKRYLENRLEINAYCRKYHKKHVKRLNALCVHKRKTNPLRRIALNQRTRTSKAFRRMGFEKSAHTAILLGADWLIVKKHMEDQFKDGMTWDNYSLWHADHKIPLSSAKNEEDLIKLCHYTNLQPLWKFDNLSKGAKTM